MIQEVTADQIALLNDTDLRTLVGYFCEREVGANGCSASFVTWGGRQDAADGGIDVRVPFPAEAVISGLHAEASDTSAVVTQGGGVARSQSL